jgi:hypothetical protein
MPDHRIVVRLGEKARFVFKGTLDEFETAYRAALSSGSLLDGVAPDSVTPVKVNPAAVRWAMESPATRETTY